MAIQPEWAIRILVASNGDPKQVSTSSISRWFKTPISFVSPNSNIQRRPEEIRLLSWSPLLLHAISVMGMIDAKISCYQYFEQEWFIEVVIALALTLLPIVSDSGFILNPASVSRSAKRTISHLRSYSLSMEQLLVCIISKHHSMPHNLLIEQRDILSSGWSILLLSFCSSKYFCYLNRYPPFSGLLISDQCK